MQECFEVALVSMLILYKTKYYYIDGVNMLMKNFLKGVPTTNQTETLQ